MIIINADDWGRTPEETDAAFRCYQQGRITSASAMVFMEDSERAAEVAAGCGLQIGLHLNLSQAYTGRGASPAAQDAHRRVVRFISSSKYAVLCYHPGLRQAFRDVYRSQADEFERLYRRSPSHVDGHQHRHLCANLLIDRIIPRGVRVRRNFTFFPQDKGVLNRAYRRWIDRWLARNYWLTDYFFSLPDCVAKSRLPQVARLAKESNVELMTHPVKHAEYETMMSAAFSDLLRNVGVAS